MKFSFVTISLVLSPWSGEAFHVNVVSPTVARSRSSVVTRTPTTTTMLNESSSSSSEEDVSHRLSIEYCTGCRWMLKSFWLAQELLTTFEEDLEAVTLIPSSDKGIFAIRLNGNDLLWDRKEQGGFPSPKGLKQIVRDMVEPKKFLGHSDTEERQQDQEEKKDAVAEARTRTPNEAPPMIVRASAAPQPSVTIIYCTGCKWLLRGAYFGQELMMTFGEELKSVTLVPSKPPAKGGQFVSFPCSRLATAFALAAKTMPVFHSLTLVDFCCYLSTILNYSPSYR
jgi:selenoprotein W-related protein